MSSPRWERALERLAPNIYNAIINGGLGIPGITPTTDVYWVDSNSTNAATAAGLSGGAGLTWDYPFANLTVALAQRALDATRATAAGAALDRCFILVADNYTQDISAASTNAVGIQFQTPDTHVIFTGDATIDLDTAIAADIDVAADAINCSMSGAPGVGLNITASFAAITNPLDINATSGTFWLNNVNMYLGGAVTVPVAWITDAAGVLQASNVFIQGVVAASLAQPVAYVKQLGYGWNCTSVLADCSGAPWVATGGHETAVTTGTVNVPRPLIICVDSLTSTGGGSLSMGWADDVDGFVASTTATDVDTGDIWSSTAPQAGTLTTPILHTINTNDIGYTVTAAVLDGGDLLFHHIWSPARKGSFLLPGAGGAFA